MDIAGMMQKAQEMQSKMADMQKNLVNQTVTGTAGAGLVSVTLTGSGEMKAVSISPEAFSLEEKEMVEDLVVAAHNDAKSRLEALMSEKMKDLTGGMGLPGGFDLSGFKMP